jgi:hypothetical protein
MNAGRMIMNAVISLLCFSKKSVESTEPSIQPFDYFKRGHFLAPLFGLHYFEEEAPPPPPPPPTTGNQSIFFWCPEMAIRIFRFKRCYFPIQELQLFMDHKEKFTRNKISYRFIKGLGKLIFAWLW